MGTPGSRDLNDVTLVHLTTPDIAKFSESIRCEDAEWGAQIEFVRQS